MKALLTALIIAMAPVGAANAQNINWRSLDEGQRNVIQFNAGYDFGVTAQLGYSRTFAWFRPVMLGADFSIPMGNTLLDDFKVRLGGQMEVIEIGGFSVTVKIASIFRRYQTDLVTIQSFGSDFGLLAGYYTPTWSVAGEFGFDKSIATYLRHSDVMKANFPGIRDGWYIPTGGHYYYGIQGGKTIGDTFDLSLRLGATNAQFDDENAVIPYYLQLGVGVRF